MFVERPEKHRHGNPVGRAERREESGHAVEPAAVQVVQISARDDPSDGRRHRIPSPCRPSRGLVVCHPYRRRRRRGHYDSRIRITDIVEPVAVEAGVAARFDGPDVPTHQGRIIAANALDVRTVGVARPAYARRATNTDGRKACDRFRPSSAPAKADAPSARTVACGSVTAAGAGSGVGEVAVGDVGTPREQDERKKDDGWFLHGFRTFGEFMVGRCPAGRFRA